MFERRKLRAFRRHARPASECFQAFSPTRFDPTAEANHPTIWQPAKVVGGPGSLLCRFKVLYPIRGPERKELPCKGPFGQNMRYTPEKRNRTIEGILVCFNGGFWGKA